MPTFLTKKLTDRNIKEGKPVPISMNFPKFEVDISLIIQCSFLINDKRKKLLSHQRITLDPLWRAVVMKIYNFLSAGSGTVTYYIRNIFG